MANYLTENIPNYKIAYTSNNNVINLKPYQSYKKINVIYPSLTLEDSNIDSETKRKTKNIKYSLYHQNNYTINYNKKNNNSSYYVSNIKEMNNSNNHSTINSYNSQHNKYINITNIAKKKNDLHTIPIIPNSKVRKYSNNVSKQIIEEKPNDLEKNRNLSFMTISNSSNKKDSYQKHNHSFFEVKSLTKDCINQKKNKLLIKINNNNSNSSNLIPEKKMVIYTSRDNNYNNTSNIRKKDTSGILNINYNINNKINLIINSKNVKYIPKTNELKKKIVINRKNSSKLIKYNNKRFQLLTSRTDKNKQNRINSYFFSYIPKKEANNKTNEKKSKQKKSKKMNTENKLTLRNLNCKTFEEDFPIKIIFNRNYRINKKLKPQIAFRLTLFKVNQAEIERYFIINFFYSENLKILDEKSKSDFYF